MFDVNLLARDDSSGDTFVVGLSLPSVHRLLEGIKRLVEEEYNQPFPTIPDLFCTHGGGLHPTSPNFPLEADLGDRALSSLPETPLAGALPSTLAPLQSEVELEPFLPPGKVLCSFCKRLISKPNFARHEKTHAGELKCEGICEFVTKNAVTMANHKLLGTCLNNDIRSKT